MDIQNPLGRFLSSPKYRLVIKRVSLLCTVIAYTSLGALLLEYDDDMRHMRKARNSILENRSNFITSVIQLSSCNQSFTELETEERFISELSWYEIQLTHSIDDGVSVAMIHSNEDSIPPRWTYVQCVFFAATVLTTIGYGNIAPATSPGKVYCILFALIGIPLTLSVIAEMGEALASLLPQDLKRFIPKKLRKGASLKLISIFGTISVLLVFISLGGKLFQIFEDWSFLDAFYFCFITTTTIGFGDLVPAPPSLLICGIYIFIGLALTSTVIELLRRQYAAYWKQMKLASSKFQQLSLPLMDALRKMAESGTGELDLELMKKLQEMDKELQAVSQDEQEKAGSTEKDPWEALIAIAEEKKRIQIVIYETSI